MAKVFCRFFVCSDFLVILFTIKPPSKHSRKGDTKIADHPYYVLKTTNVVRPKVVDPSYVKTFKQTNKLELFLSKTLF